MLHGDRLLVIDPLISQNIDELLCHRIVRRAESSNVCKRFLRMLHLQDTATDRADENRDKLKEDELLLSFLQGCLVCAS
jgi:hypothetical protein